MNDEHSYRDYFKEYNSYYDSKGKFLPIHACSRCHAIIYEEDVFYDIEGKIYCEECIEDFKEVAQR